MTNGNKRSARASGASRRASVRSAGTHRTLAGVGRSPRRPCRSAPRLGRRRACGAERRRGPPVGGCDPQNSAAVRPEGASGARVVWSGGRGAGRDVVSLLVSLPSPLSRAILRVGLRPPLDRRLIAGAGDPSATVWRCISFSRVDLARQRLAPPSRDGILYQRTNRSFVPTLFSSRRAKPATLCFTETL